jgi:hypothetical protein
MLLELLWASLGKSEFIAAESSSVGAVFDSQRTAFVKRLRVNALGLLFWGEVSWYDLLKTFYSKIYGSLL